MNGQNKRRAWLLYTVLITLFVTVLWWIQYYDKSQGGGVSALTEVLSPWQNFVQSVSHHALSDIGMLLVQLVVILVVVRLVGWIFTKLHQPTVIGEILAGILLGPSLLGYLWPEGMELLFPEHSLRNLELLSQFGLILFMFTIGMELRMRDIKGQAREALIISQSGIILPFVLGVFLTYSIFHDPALGITSNFLSLSLFVGISLSITAFPVLARIIQERSLSHSHLGRLALSTAASGDIVAWLMLAAIMAVSQGGSFTSALYNMLFLGIYLIIIFGIFRPLFGLVGRVFRHKEIVTKSLMGLIFILLLASSYFTEIMSMHALFGAFMLGLIMPENLNFRVILKDKVEDVSLLLFLPLFFVSSGLRTELGLVNTPTLWLLFGLFTLVAIVGKMGGTFLSARLCGINVRESLYLGAYMNTRGLMELVVLRIGLDLGILPPVIFTILVMMTLVTTIMTAPMLELIDWILKRGKEKKVVAQDHGKVLISFGRPETGVMLLRLFHRMCGGAKPAVGCTVMHVTTDTDISTIDADHFYQSSFAPILEESKALHYPVETKYEIADSAPDRIVSYATNQAYNMLLVGAGLNMSPLQEDQEIVEYHDKLTRRWGRLSVSASDALLRTKRAFEDNISTFVQDADCTVGIFVDHGLTPIARPLVLIGEESDLDLIPFALQSSLDSNTEIDLLPTNTHLTIDHSLIRGRTRLLSDAFTEEFDFSSYDFVFVGYNTWENFDTAQIAMIEEMPSFLILDIDRTNVPLPALRRPHHIGKKHIGKNINNV